MQQCSTFGSLISRHFVQRLTIAIWIAICFYIMTIFFMSSFEKCQVSTVPAETGIRKRIQHIAKMGELEANRFNSIFGNIVKVASSQTKQLLYECDRKCQTGSRFYRGLVSAFMFSILSGRRFGILTNSACSVFTYYNQTCVRWNFDSLQEYPDHQIANLYIPEKEETHPYQSMGFIKSVLYEFEGKEWGAIVQDVVLFSGDPDITNDILRHKHSFDKLPKSVRSLDTADLTRILFSGLFETPMYIQNAIQNQLLEQVDETERLVCFHSTEAFEQTDIVAMSLLKTYGIGYKVYFSAGGINEEAFREHYGRVIKLDLTEFTERTTCRNGFDMVVNAYVLKLCHVLITTKDPIGVAAAEMRGNSNGLFCCDEFGVIYPCKWRLISDSFRDETTIPVELIAKTVRTWTDDKQQTMEIN